MYQQIVNPETGRKVNIFSKLGQRILNNYIYQMGGASLSTTHTTVCETKGDCRGSGKKCRKKDKGCEYIPKAQASARGVDKWGCYQCSESEVESSSSKSEDDSTQESLEMRLQKLNEEDEGPPYDKWEEFVDVDGSFYYYNAKLNETIHKKPDDYLPDGKEDERVLEAAENKREYEERKHDPSTGQSFKYLAEVFTVELEESEEEHILRMIEETEEELREYNSDGSRGPSGIPARIEALKRELIDFRGYYKIEELLEEEPHKIVVDNFDIAGYECFKPTVLEKHDYKYAKLIKCEVDEESRLREKRNDIVKSREYKAADKRLMDEIKEKLDVQGFQYEDGDLVENISKSGYRTEDVYIIRTNMDSGLLYVDWLNTEMDDYGHVGEGFSLGPKRPFCYWRHAKFTKAYWHSNPLPEPLESKYWNPIEIEDLKEYTETRKKYDGSEYNVTFCHYNLGWGTLRFPGNTEQVMKFLSDQKNSETERLYFEAVGDCSDGGTDLVELSDQFYYIEDGSQYN